MFTVITIYNNKTAFETILLPSLKQQDQPYELIAVDNTSGKYRSAASAFNDVAPKAKGDLLLLIHQDVELEGTDWLSKAATFIRAAPNLGIAGVAGMSTVGKTNPERARGYLWNCGQVWVWSHPVAGPEPVQTLDECVLILPKTVFAKQPFDPERFDGWHCYGADYCLSVQRQGFQSYVLPLTIFHRSSQTNTDQLLKHHIRLLRKHWRHTCPIYTTMGTLSVSTLLKRSIKAMIAPLYNFLFPEWTRLLRKEIGSGRMVLDLGCGYNTPLQFCAKPRYSVGVESYDPYLQESSKRQLHDKHIKADLLEASFASREFDIVLCSEVIEHLRKEDGLVLLKRMSDWAREKVIVTTPNGFLGQVCYDDNNLQEHLSGWKVDEFRAMGFRVRGMGGLKYLRGSRGAMRVRPYFFARLISDLTQLVCGSFPKLAFQLFAVKEIQ